MIKHVVLILLITALAVTGIFLPYFHGDYDYFAVGLSFIFQFAAFASLLLVPIGLIWRFPFCKTAALVVAALIFMAAALGAFASHNRFAAMIILGGGMYLLVKLRKKAFTNAIRYYFIFIPLVVVCLRMVFFEKVKDKSTHFVITQSEQLIQDIEAYKNTNGHYPLSLQSTIEDYKTFVSGIERFHYEPSGNAYNLYFEQLSDRLGTQEIVMYNKLGEHEMTVHNQDLLRITPGNILRGYHAVAELPQKNWKIFYFD